MNLPLSRAHTLALCALAAAASSASAQGILSQYGEVIMTSGMGLPGSNGASPNDFPPLAVVASNNSSVFATPVISLNGDVLFKAKAVQDPTLLIDGANDAGIFLGRAGGDLRMVVRASDQAPGCLAGTLLRSSSLTAGSNGLNARRVSTNGDLLMIASSLYDPITPGNTPTASDTAYFFGAVGGLALLAREGDLVPSLTGGEVYGQLDVTSNQSFLLNTTGTTVIRNQMVIGTGGVTASNDAIILVGPFGSLQKMLREGDQWTGVGNTGEVLDRYSSNNQFPSGLLILNEAGMVAHDLHFLVPSGTPATTTANDRALAIWLAGTDTIVAREGDQAPGMPAGAVFADASAFSGFPSVSQTAFNKAGQLFFASSFPVGPGGVTAADDQALFLASIGSLTFVQREGDPAPASLGAGVFWGAVNTSSMAINDVGQVAFFASLTGAVATTDDTAMFLGTPGNMSVIAREGDVVTGLTPSANGPWTIQAISQAPHLTSRGYVVWPQSVFDSVASKTVWLSHTPQHGVRVLIDPAETWTTVLGTGAPTSIPNSGTIQSGDTTSVTVNDHGDFTVQLVFPTGMGSAIVRGHCGSLVAEPSSVPVVGGVPQDFHIDCGVAQAGQLYLVIASGLGTRPGFFPGLSLNYDPVWTDLSLNNPNSIVWPGTLGFLDGMGKGGPASFLMPPGFPGFQGATLHHSVFAFEISPAFAVTFISEPSAVKLY